MATQTFSLPVAAYPNEQIIGPMTVPAGFENAHIELTSNQWKASSDQVNVFLEWFDGTLWQPWQGLGCTEGDRTSKGFMPQFEVTLLPGMPASSFQARIRVVVIGGSVRVGMSGYFTYTA